MIYDIHYFIAIIIRNTYNVHLLPCYQCFGSKVRYFNSVFGTIVLLYIQAIQFSSSLVTDSGWKLVVADIQCWFWDYSLFGGDVRDSPVDPSVYTCCPCCCTDVQPHSINYLVIFCVFILNAWQLICGSSKGYIIVRYFIYLVCPGSCIIYVMLLWRCVIVLHERYANT